MIEHASKLKERTGELEDELPVGGEPARGAAADRAQPPPRGRARRRRGRRGRAAHLRRQAASSTSSPRTTSTSSRPPTRWTCRVPRGPPGPASPTSRARRCCWSSHWCATRWTSRSSTASRRCWCRCWSVARRWSAPASCPRDEQQLFRTDDRDDLYLIGTSEVPLASYHTDEILEPEDLPLRYAGYSPCFRREAGAAGKDTRGILRVHQFEKVELFSFCAPGGLRPTEHQRMLSIEEEVFSRPRHPRPGRGHPDRRPRCVSASRKFDIEAWLPGQGAYREVTSTSNTTDYQARRLDVPHPQRPGRATSPPTPATARPSRSSGRSSRWSRPTSARTARVAVPERLQPHLGREVLFAR